MGTPYLIIKAHCKYSWPETYFSFWALPPAKRDVPLSLPPQNSSKGSALAHPWHLHRRTRWPTPKPIARWVRVRTTTSKTARRCRHRYPESPRPTTSTRRTIPLWQTSLQITQPQLPPARRRRWFRFVPRRASWSSRWAAPPSPLPPPHRKQMLL